MPRVGFEPMIAAFERAKTVHALDHTATVIGNTTEPHLKPVCTVALLGFSLKFGENLASEFQGLFVITDSRYAGYRIRVRWGPEMMRWSHGKPWTGKLTSLSRFIPTTSRTEYGVCWYNVTFVGFFKDLSLDVCCVTKQITLTTFNYLYIAMAILSTTCFSIQKLPTEHICVFRMVPTINSDCFPKQH
jgi:hypothetical protein